MSYSDRHYYEFSRKIKEYINLYDVDNAFYELEISKKGVLPHFKKEWDEDIYFLTITDFMDRSLEAKFTKKSIEKMIEHLKFMIED